MSAPLPPILHLLPCTRAPAKGEYIYMCPQLLQIGLLLQLIIGPKGIKILDIEPQA